MPSKRQISVSTVAYDGYPIELAFQSLRRLGIKLVEPAYIKGYMAFTEENFSAAAASSMVAQFKAFSLSALAISAHMDCGAEDAVAMLARRLRFTAGIGARYTITNSATYERRDVLLRTIEANIPLAEMLGVVIALENPGHGNTNLIPNAEIGAEIIRGLDSPHVCMNYDAANALTCFEGATRPEEDVDFALPISCHMHLKDVVRHKGQWSYVAIGEGEIDYRTLLAKLSSRPDIPLTLELPLRLRRHFHSDPERDPMLTPIQLIEAVIRKSWRFCESYF